jgi:hypothetical protein
MAATHVYRSEPSRDIHSFAERVLTGAVVEETNIHPIHPTKQSTQST